MDSESMTSSTLLAESGPAAPNLHQPPSTRPSSRLPVPAWWQRDRWRYAAGCFLVGMFYTAAAMYFGFELKLLGHDVSLLAGFLLELSFGVLGYLLGATREARQGEKQAAQDSAAQIGRLAEMRIRLAQTEKLASLGQLAGTVAHEVRNPLAIIRSMVQNLAEEPALNQEPALRAACEGVLEEVDRLADVTSRLVDFARPLDIRPRPVAVVDLLLRARRLLLALPEGKGTEVVIAGPNGVIDLSVDPSILAGPKIEVDAELICQVLLGLMVNSVEASRGAGVVPKVELWWLVEQEPAQATSADPGMADVVSMETPVGMGTVVLQVLDRGPGIPEELEQRIFEPFFTTKADGHGLGLAVAKQVVTAHGGRLTGLSRSSGGAVISLWLPVGPTGDMNRKVEQ